VGAGAGEDGGFGEGDGEEGADGDGEDAEADVLRAEAVVPGEEGAEELFLVGLAMVLVDGVEVQGKEDGYAPR